MSRNIQAYFHTEDDALGVSTKLQAYGLEQLEVSRLPQSIGRDRSLLVPLGAGLAPGPSGVGGGGFPVGNTGPTNGGVITGAAFTGTVRDQDQDRVAGAPEGGTKDRDFPVFYDGDRDDFRYVLSAKVKDELHDEVFDIIRSNKGYIEIFE